MRAEVQFITRQKPSKALKGFLKGGRGECGKTTDMEKCSVSCQKDEHKKHFAGLVFLADPIQDSKLISHCFESLLKGWNGGRG